MKRPWAERRKAATKIVRCWVAPTQHTHLVANQELVVFSINERLSSNSQNPTASLMLLCNAASSTSALTRFDFGGLVSRRLHDLRSLFSRLTHKAPRLRLQFNDLVSRGF